MPAFIDLTGQRFGKLITLELLQQKQGNERKWLCRCDCGKEKSITGVNLRVGKAKTCGHCKKESISDTGHGHTSVHGVSPTYVSWRAMRVRCTNTKRDGAKYYVGITFDPRWNDFAVFLEDMGERLEGRTLDRINNDLGYSKENCRWATPYEQTHNRRCSRRLAA